jgi:short chain dehydrogenase
VSNNKIWFISGAGRGMGADVAKAALAAGHSVVASGRDTDRVSKALGRSNDLLPVKLDVTSRTDAEAAVRARGRGEWSATATNRNRELCKVARNRRRIGEESARVQPANNFLAIHRASLARCGPSTSDPATAPSNSTIRARAVAFASFTPAADVHSRKRSANHSR